MTLPQNNRFRLNTNTTETINNKEKKNRIAVDCQHLRLTEKFTYLEDDISHEGGREIDIHNRIRKACLSFTNLTLMLG